jgi:hypothetical protein
MRRQLQMEGKGGPLSGTFLAATPATGLCVRHGANLT